MKNITALSTLALAACSFAQDGGAAPGLDPTKFVSQLQVRYEHSNLRRSEDQRRLRFMYDIPIKDLSIRVEAPLVATTLGSGHNQFDFGDFLLKATKLLKVTPTYGMWADLEGTFDTATSEFRGSGKTVVSGTLGYASFQSFGIIAPAYKHSLSVAGHGYRSDVNTGTLDLYFVPYLKQKNLFATVDLGFVFDFENDANFQFLKVTGGSKVGKFGKGILQAGITPAIYFGGDRPVNTSFEIFIKAVGF